MSDFSALSHDYEASSRLAEDLNDAILTIKKSRLNLRSGLGIDQRRALADTVESVKQLLAPEKQESAVEVEHIPQEVVQRLSDRNRARMAYFVEDLSHTAGALRKEGSAFDDVLIGTLDEICDAADATASSLFRRMRRR